MRCIIRQLDHKNSTGIWFYEQQGNRNLLAKQMKLEYTEVPECFMLPEPTLEISNMHSQEFLQSLVNALIEQGLRPNNDKAAGELEATKKHLKDLQDTMSKLFNLLNKFEITRT